MAVGQRTRHTEFCAIIILELPGHAAAVERTRYVPMPPLSAHFRFATLVTTPLGIKSHAGSFLLGATAPDAFEPDNEDGFSRHHFVKGKNGRISLERFLEDTNFIPQPSDSFAWSFTCGYYSHLWLDNYYRDNADRLPHKKPAGISDADLMGLARKEAEILTRPSFWKLANYPYNVLKTFYCQLDSNSWSSSDVYVCSVR